MTFRAQLLLFMILPIVALAALMGGVATRTASETIKHDAIRAVGVAANAREQKLLAQLSQQKDRADNLARLAAGACASAPNQSECIQDRIVAFTTTENASGVRLSAPNQTFTAGTVSDRSEATNPLPSTQLARFGPRQKDRWYVVQGEAEGATATVQYPVSQLQPIFDDTFGLGESGETFLADPQGYFVTKAAYGGAGEASHPIESAPMKTCLSGKSDEMLRQDYRRVEAVHGFRYVEALGGACIMAHIDQTEAFAPVRELQRELIWLTLIGLLGASLLAGVLARRLTDPLKRLTLRAREIRDGRTDAPVPVEGPTEIREFAATFAGMVRTLEAEQSRLKEAVNELKRAEERKDDFVRMAGHELKTPVTSLSIYTETLRRRLRKDGHPAAQKADSIAGQLQNLTSLIGALLDIARLDANRFQLTRTPVNLEALVHETAAMIERSADSHRIKITGSIEKPVEADETRLRQVLTNLLANAVKYSPDAKEVLVRLESQEGQAVVEVQDFGVGIPKEELPRIFERYRRVHGTDETTFSGLGVGLYISKQIVKLHDGSLKVKSGKEGTTFTLKLPTST